MADQSKPITNGWEEPLVPPNWWKQGGSIEKDKMPKEAMDVYQDCVRKVKPDHGKQIGELTVKVNIDCSDALKGLKAVQREAKKATQALKELDKTKRYIGVDLANGPDQSVVINHETLLANLQVKS
ncbi:hypothetical protein E4665_17785 [Sporolactobacillus shoreae]|uniref:Uncharacterized protein n=1 Tax=Sporolactobacillus shoreae TaxID=1465501 RepID=A0A4Z0GJT3_9BACL|nr:hypothetical protein [Sporolactobacillus shoreae]TGA95624.1 hypothetical protein E4665_17785 [Sporolactobacillus shoreae]